MRTKNQVSSEDFRSKILFVAFTAYFVLIVFRLFFIQIIQHNKYKALAMDQYWDLSVLPAQRGDIISSDGIVLAGTQTYYLLYIEPQKVTDYYEIATVLSDFFSEKRNWTTEDRDNFSKKILSLKDSKLFWFSLLKEVRPDEKKELEDKGLVGIGFEDDPIRYYPEDTLASHVLGFVAYNDLGEKQGYFGVEGALNGELKGKPGRILQETDALGNPILLGGFKSVSPVKGRDVYLTINRSVQYLAEKKLKEGVEKFDAKSGSVIIMDPITGEIIAMANYPNFHPRDFSYHEEKEDAHRKEVEKRNISISQTYEPGSVIKPLTVSSAMDLGLVNPDTQFTDSGPVRYSDYFIDNWDFKHLGVLTVRQLLEKSNNIGAAWVGTLVGRDRLYDYFTKFGIGKTSGIELEGEDTGYMRDLKIWTDIDLATASFGQGISATPLQVINAFNVFANGGYLLEPKIISKLIDNGKEITISKKKPTQILKTETANTMNDVLNSAAHSGEAKFFILKNYNISGKTGTAQIPENGVYNSTKTNATFVGYLTNSKKFSMIVRLEEPKNKIYASETAVPIWMSIAEDLIKYYGIPADRNVSDN